MKCQEGPTTQLESGGLDHFMLDYVELGVTLP